MQSVRDLDHGMPGPLFRLFYSLSAVRRRSPVHRGSRPPRAVPRCAAADRTAMCSASISSKPAFQHLSRLESASSARRRARSAPSAPLYTARSRLSIIGSSAERIGFGVGIRLLLFTCCAPFEILVYVISRKIPLSFSSCSSLRLRKLFPCAASQSAFSAPHSRPEAQPAPLHQRENFLSPSVSSPSLARFFFPPCPYSFSSSVVPCIRFDMISLKYLKSAMILA